MKYRLLSLMLSLSIQLLGEINFEPHNYGLDNSRVLEESNPDDPEWFLNSGGYFIVAEQVGRTLFGNLELGSKWQLEHAKSNPIDTENGEKPQNIFRLLTKNKYREVGVQAYFKVAQTNLSASSFRRGDNAILLFPRYVDQDNLYYAGLRVDGDATIKKKSNGIYYPLAQYKVLPGEYDRDTNPTLIQKDQWIGVRTIIDRVNIGQVRIRLWIDMDGTGNWKFVMAAHDDTLLGGYAFSEGNVGIRTDFMDVWFSRIQIVPPSSRTENND